MKALSNKRVERPGVILWGRGSRLAPAAHAQRWADPGASDRPGDD